MLRKVPRSVSHSTRTWAKKTIPIPRRRVSASSMVHSSRGALSLGRPEVELRPFARFHMRDELARGAPPAVAHLESPVSAEVNQPIHVVPFPRSAVGAYREPQRGQGNHNPRDAQRERDGAHLIHARDRRPRVRQNRIPGRSTRSAAVVSLHLRRGRAPRRRSLGLHLRLPEPPVGRISHSNSDHHRTLATELLGDGQ